MIVSNRFSLIEDNTLWVILLYNTVGFCKQNQKLFCSFSIRKNKKLISVLSYLFINLILLNKKWESLNCQKEKMVNFNLI